jgi:hypothetical protein
MHPRQCSEPPRRRQSTLFRSASGRTDHQAAGAGVSPIQRSRMTLSCVITGYSEGGVATPGGFKGRLRNE